MPRVGDYYYHGTSLLSVYTSYRTANAFEKAVHQQQRVSRQANVSIPSPRTDLTILAQQDATFLNYGPNYPSIQRPEVCLTNSLGKALPFASGWNLDPLGTFPGESVSFFSESQRSLRFNRSDFIEGALAPYLSDVAELITTLSYEKPFTLPGAILVTDACFLFGSNFFTSARGEETARVSYLPWLSVAGVLLVWPEERLITSFGFTSKIPLEQIQQDFDWKTFRLVLTLDDRSSLNLLKQAF